MVPAHVEKQPTAGGALALGDSIGVLRGQQSGRGLGNEPDRQSRMIVESAPSPRDPRRAEFGQLSMTIRGEKAALQSFDSLQPDRVAIVWGIDPGGHRLP